MPKPDFKTAVILDATLPCGIAINTAIHLAIQLGCQKPSLGGTGSVDLSGIIHSGIPIYPNVVLMGSGSQIHDALERARINNQEMVVLDYPREGHTTSTEEEYRAAIMSTHEPSIQYYGCLFFGPKNLVSRFTKEFSLWKCTSAKIKACCDGNCGASRRVDGINVSDNS